MAIEPASISSGPFMHRSRVVLLLVEATTDRGIDEAAATRYVCSPVAALAETACLTPDGPLHPLIPAHETPGSLIWRVRTHLEGLGWFDALEAASRSTSGLRSSDLG